MGLDKLLTHTAKEKRKFLLVTSSKAGTVKGKPGFSLSAFGLFTCNNWRHGTEPLPPNMDPKN